MNESDIKDRLDKIDGKLDSIQQLMIDTALQQKDIDLLKEEVKQLKEEQKALKDQITELKENPNRTKAEKWAKVESWVFAGALAFLGGCIVYIIKQGLVGNVLQ